MSKDDKAEPDDDDMNLGEWMKAHPERSAQIMENMRRRRRGLPARRESDR